jgi:ArsR family transcriptional regulator
LNKVFLSRKVDIFKALAHPVRLEIAERLLEGEHCVCEIAEWFPFDRTTISKHLSVLRNAGVIADRKEGLNVYYALRMCCLKDLLSCLEDTLQRDLRDQVEALEMAQEPSRSL